MRLLVIFAVFGFMFPIWSMDPPRTISKDTILADLLEKFPELKMGIETWGEDKIVNYIYSGNSIKGYEEIVKRIFRRLNLQEDKTDFSEFSSEYIALIYTFETNKTILKNLFIYLQNNSKDNPDLQNLLSLFYDSGKGGVQSSEEALEQARAAAQAGSSYAMFNYYVSLSESSAIENIAQAREAFKFLERAAKKLPGAMYTLSLLKLGLKDVAPTQSERFEKVDESGSREDQSEMASKPTKYLQPPSERSGKVDESGSREDQSEIASKPLIPNFKAKLTYIKELGQNEKINKAYQQYREVHHWTFREHEKNIEDAVALMERAASAQCVEAQYIYYFVVKDLGLLHLRNRGIQYLREAAENGHNGAQGSLADAYRAFPHVHGGMFKKEGIEPNYQLAARYYLHCARQGNFYSIGIIGQMLADGEGLERNVKDGMFLLEFAWKECTDAAYYLMKKYQLTDEDKALDYALKVCKCTGQKAEIYKNEVAEAKGFIEKKVKPNYLKDRTQAVMSLWLSKD